MTPDTSSHSAKGTQKTDALADTSGTQPIETSYGSTYEKLRQFRRANEVAMTDHRYFLWVSWGKIKHIFGIHTYVPLEEWDPNSGWVRYIGSACWHCPKTMR